MLSHPVITTDVGRLNAKCRHSTARPQSSFCGIAPEASGFIPSSAIPCSTSFGTTCLPEAPEARVQHVDRHLRGVEMELVLRRDLQHPQMHRRILVPREPDVADLPRLLRLQQRLQRPPSRKTGPGPPCGCSRDTASGRRVRLQPLAEIRRSASPSPALVRPSNFVIRKTFCRYPSRRALPIRTSHFPSA